MLWKSHYNTGTMLDNKIIQKILRVHKESFINIEVLMVSQKLRKEEGLLPTYFAES